MPTAIARVVASVCVIVAAVLILIAHRRRPELPASEIALSVYFTDPTRKIMISAYAAIAAALFSVSVIVTTQIRATATAIAAACCIGAVLLVPVVATTQRDITMTRSEATKRIHRYAAASAFAAIGVAMAVSAYVAIVDVDVPIAVLGLFGTTMAGRVLQRKQSATHGLQQKIMLAILGLWIITIAVTG